MRTIILILSFVFTISTLSAQDLYFSFFEKEEFEINEHILREANSITDLHHRHSDDWIDSYISTEIIYQFNNQVISEKGKNNTLSTSQKELIKNAVVGSSIKVVIDYMPKNTLKNNTPKQADFKIKVIPENLPLFEGGEEGFKSYFEKNFISKLDTSELTKLSFSVVSLDINSSGKTDNVYLNEGTGNIELDAKLSQVLCNMPTWEPASKSNGEIVDYALKFYITNVNQSCRVNELIVRKENISGSN